MRKNLLFSVILSVAITGQIFADEVMQTEILTIFNTDNTPPIILDSTREWIAIGVIEWNYPGRNKGNSHSTKRWRLRSRYEHQHSTGPTTVQIRIRSNMGTSVFTHPWAQSADRTSESYSNWFEDPKHLVDSGNRSIVEAKLIAPPRTPLQGTLYSVALEAWNVDEDAADRKHSGRSVNLAYARSLSALQESANENIERHGPKEAMEFALEFVGYCLTGDLASYYRMQAETVYYLENGRAVKKYLIPPPSGIHGIDNLEEYKRRFDYRLYDADTFTTMFTEWVSDSREWKPGRNSYLFMGNRDVTNEINLENVDFLVFLVDLDDNGEWKIVARPGK